MSEGFLTDINTAMLFFRVCRRYKIDDPKDRLLLMRTITSRGKAKYIRDVADFTQNKRVIKVDPIPQDLQIKPRKDSPND